MKEYNLDIKVKVKGELVSNKELNDEEIQEEILDNLEVISYNDYYTIYDVEKEINTYE